MITSMLCVYVFIYSHYVSHTRILICYDMHVLGNTQCAKPWLVSPGQTSPCSPVNSSLYFEVTLDNLSLRFRQCVTSKPCSTLYHALWHSVAVRCAPLAYFDKSVSGPYSGVIGTSVTFRCRRGHRYRDGTTETTLRCQENGKWEETEDCKGVYDPAWPFSILKTTWICLHLLQLA